MYWYYNGHSRRLDGGYPRCSNFNGTSESDYGSDTYYGFFAEWNRFAAFLLSFVVAPLNARHHWELYENLYTGETVDSLLASARLNVGLLIFEILLVVAVIVSIAVMIIGRARKCRKEQKVPIPVAMRERTVMVKLLFAHVPLFLITLGLAVVFTLSIWPSRHTIQGGTIDKIKNIEREQLYKGQCAVDNLGDELEDFGKLIHNTTTLIANPCQELDRWLERRLDVIQYDKESLKELRETAETLQNSIIEKEEGNRSVTRELIKKVIWRVVGQLEMLDQALVEMDTNTTKTIDSARKRKEVLKAGMEEANAVLESSLKSTLASFKEVKKSLDGAVTQLSQHVQAVAQRFTKMQKTKTDPLVFYIFMQVVVTTAAIGGAFLLGVAFVALFVGLAEPTVFDWAPSAARSLRRFLTFGFFCLGVFAVFLFLISAMILRFVGPISSVCSTLTDIDDGFIYSSPARDFYDTIGTKITLTDAKGKQMIITFSDLLSADNYESLASERGNRQRDLFPKADHRKAFDQWTETLRSKKAVSTEPIEFPDQSKLLHSLKLSVTSLDAIDNSYAPSDYADVRMFRNLLKQLSLPSLNETTLPACNSPLKKENFYWQLSNNFDRTFKLFEEELLGRNQYQTSKFIYVYRGDATSGFCVELRTPLSGSWLSAMLLGFVLLLDMIALYKVSNRLFCEHKEVPALENYASCVLSTISTPSLDQKFIEI